MSELISIREASRRLEVSDTAVHKAIKSGRVTVAQMSDVGRPLLSWPECQEQYKANTNPALQRKPPKVEDKPAPRRQKREEDPPPMHASDGGGAIEIHSGMDYMEAKTAREIYAARQGRLVWEQASGKLVEIASVRLDLFKATRAARDLLMTMEDRLSPVLASETDIQAVRAILRDDVRKTCDRLASALGAV